MLQHDIKNLQLDTRTCYLIIIQERLDNVKDARGHFVHLIKYEDILSARGHIARDPIPQLNLQFNHHNPAEDECGITPTLELQTKVHTKVRNYGEGPYI